MGNTVAFSIEGPIRGKARVRSRGTQFFKDAKTRNAETGIGWAAKNAMRGLTPFQGAVELDVLVYVTAPKSWTKQKKASAVYVTGKPDADNIAKSIADALNGIIYADDRQISDLKVRRRYRDTAGADVLVRELAA